MGMRSPIFMVDFWPSVARMRGFCRILELESVMSRLAVAAPTVMAKLLALRLARLSRVKLGVVGVPVVLLVVGVVLVVGGWGAKLMLPGQVKPMLRSLSLSTSMMATSTTT